MFDNEQFDEVGFDEEVITSHAYTQTLSETMSLSENKTTRVKKTLSDSILLVEMIGKKIVKALQEIVGLSDTIIKKAKKTIAESLSIIESINVKQSFRRALSELTSIVESIKIKSVLHRTFLEVVSVADTIIKKARKIFSESTGILDSVISHKVTQKIISETVSIVESIKKKTNKILSETLSLAERLIKKTAMSFVEAIDINDIFGHKVNKIINEILSIAESIRRKTKKVIAEQLLVVENISKKMHRVIRDIIKFGVGYGNAILFNGTTSIIDLGNNTSLDLGFATWSAWVYPTSFADHPYHTVISKYYATSYWFGLYSNIGTIQLWAGGGAVVSTGAIPLNQWSLITATWDGSVVKFYINGQFDSQVARSASPITSTRDAIIGGDPQSSSYRFTGMIDEVRIYGRVLSDTEIQQHYNGLFIDESEIIGLWHFDEGSGTTTADSSGNGNNGTLVGTPTWVKSTIPSIGRVVRKTGKVIKDALLFIDSIKKATNKVLKDVAIIIEDIKTKSVFARIIANTIGIVDKITKGNRRTVNDLISTVDRIAKKGQKNIGDLISIAEKLSFRGVFSRTISDTIKVKEAIIKGVKKVLSEIVKLKDKVIAQIIRMTDFFRFFK